MTGAAIGKGVWVVRTGTNSMKHSRKNEDMVKYERDVTEPAPTVDAKAGSAWRLVERQAHGATRQAHEPAMTITGSADNGNFQWVEERPGTPIKITEADALTLQSFRPDYPLQGSRSKRFEQVGNAVPPALAAAIIGALVTP